MASGTGVTTPLDVITMGRCSVDLYGQQIGSRLEDVGVLRQIGRWLSLQHCHRHCAAGIEISFDHARRR